MHIPQSFSDRLKADFNGRFRIRWSHKRSEFHIEQRLATAQILEPPKNMEGVYDTYDDDYICAKDGYGPVMSVRQGDRMPCRRCKTTVRVPIRETREAVCSICGKRHKAAFYALDDLLLLHLRWIDPLSGGIDRVRKHVAERNRERQLARDRAAYGEMDAAGLDHFNQLFGIQQAGYTGKVFKDATK